MTSTLITSDNSSDFGQDIEYHDSTLSIDRSIITGSVNQFPRKIMKSRHRSLANLQWLPKAIAEELKFGEKPDRALQAYMLLHGFSVGFHVATLGRSHSAVRGYRLSAEIAAEADRAVGALTLAATAELDFEAGRVMALFRNGAHLPYWSRLAIRQAWRQGMSREEIGFAFACAPGTVSAVLQGKKGAFKPLTGQRLLSVSQLTPPNRWRGQADLGGPLG